MEEREPATLESLATRLEEVAKYASHADSVVRTISSRMLELHQFAILPRWKQALVIFAGSFAGGALVTLAIHIAACVSVKP